MQTAMLNFCYYLLCSFMICQDIFLLRLNQCVVLWIISYSEGKVYERMRPADPFCADFIIYCTMPGNGYIIADEKAGF